MPLPTDPTDAVPTSDGVAPPTIERDGAGGRYSGCSRARDRRSQHDARPRKGRGDTFEASVTTAAEAVNRDRHRIRGAAGVDGIPLVDGGKRLRGCTGSQGDGSGCYAAGAYRGRADQRGSVVEIDRARKGIGGDRGCGGRDRRRKCYDLPSGGRGGADRQRSRSGRGAGGRSGSCPWSPCW